MQKRVLLGVFALVLGSGCATTRNTANNTSRNISGEATPREIEGSNPLSTGISSNGETSSIPPEVVETELKAENPKVDLNSSEDAQIPKEVNVLVLKWVDYFTGRGRSHMERYLSRSTRYAPMMKEILKKNGLPEDLIYLALIESGFSSHARSHASAVGYWQFMRGTGRTYGLQTNKLLDERRDFVRSTEAASSYLKGLYNLFGSWYLAIASYNVGENRIKRLVMKHQTRDFWALSKMKGLPRETVDYVPKFIAARMIAQHPEKFGFKDIAYEAPVQFDTIRIEKPISLKILAKNSELNHEELRDLNPMFRTEYVPVESGFTVLRVPLGKSELAAQHIEGSQVSVKVAVQNYESDEGFRKHRVRAGETLGSIARRYRISLSSLRDANDLGRRAVIRAGAVLNIPQNGRRSVANRAKAELRLEAKAASRVAMNSPMKLNGKSNSKSVSKPTAKLNPKLTAKVTSRPREESREEIIYMVRRGDTIANIARKHRVPVHQLIAVNRLKNQTKLSAGRKLIIPD